MRKKNAVVSGWDAEGSSTHVHCPRCGKIIARYVEQERRNRLEFDRIDKILMHACKYLKENGLIKGDKSEGYQKTKKGDIWHDILKKHSDLVGVLTRELSGDRRKRL